MTGRSIVFLVIKILGFILILMVSDHKLLWLFLSKAAGLTRFCLVTLSIERYDREH